MEKYYLQQDVYRTPLSEQEYNLAQELIQEGKQPLDYIIIYVTNLKYTCQHCDKVTLNNCACSNCGQENPLNL
jgi:hypothetical protein